MRMSERVLSILFVKGRSLKEQHRKKHLVPLLFFLLLFFGGGGSNFFGWLLVRPSCTQPPHIGMPGCVLQFEMRDSRLYVYLCDEVQLQIAHPTWRCAPPLGQRHTFGQRGGLARRPCHGAVCARFVGHCGGTASACLVVWHGGKVCGGVARRVSGGGGGDGGCFGSRGSPGRLLRCGVQEIKMSEPIPVLAPYGRILPFLRGTSHTRGNRSTYMGGG